MPTKEQVEKKLAEAEQKLAAMEAQAAQAAKRHRQHKRRLSPRLMH